MDRLKLLREDLVDAQDKVRTLRELIDIEREKVELPLLRKKFEGKYFKYRNSYSTPDTGWWLYKFCQKVLTVNNCQTFSFQTDTYDKVEFQTEKHDHYSSFQQEISEKEFMAAYNKAIKDIKAARKTTASNKRKLAPVQAQSRKCRKTGTSVC